MRDVVTLFWQYFPRYLTCQLGLATGRIHIGLLVISVSFFLSGFSSYSSSPLEYDSIFSPSLSLTDRRRRPDPPPAGLPRWPATASSSGTLLPLLLLLYGVWVKPKHLNSNWVQGKPNNPFGFVWKPKTRYQISPTH